MSIEYGEGPELKYANIRIDTSASIRVDRSSVFHMSQCAIGKALTISGDITRISLERDTVGARMSKKDSQIKISNIKRGERSCVIFINNVICRGDVIVENMTLDSVQVVGNTRIYGKLRFVNCGIASGRIYGKEIRGIEFINTTVKDNFFINARCLASPVVFEGKVLETRVNIVIDTAAQGGVLPVRDFAHLQGRVALRRNVRLNSEQNRHGFRQMYERYALQAEASYNYTYASEIRHAAEKAVLEEFGSPWERFIGWLFNYRAVPYNFIMIMLSVFITFALVFLGYGVHSMPLGVDLRTPDTPLHRWTTALWFSGSVLVSIRFKQQWTLVQQRGMLAAIIIEWSIGVILLLAFATFATDGIQGFEFLRRWFGSQ